MLNLKKYSSESYNNLISKDKLKVEDKFKKVENTILEKVEFKKIIDSFGKIV